MVRDFIGASTDAATESQIGTAAGLLAGVYSIAQVRTWVLSGSQHCTMLRVESSGSQVDFLTT